MKKYFCFFRIRFINGLQYRAAALAGVCTQFFWGALTILMFSAFYKSAPDAFPMPFEALSSYIWLQQAFLSLFMTWFYETQIFDSITQGHIAYELCRPIDLYGMWFIRNMANRLSRAALRCLPILLVAALLPAPWGLSLSHSPGAFLLFVVSMLMGFLVLVAMSMLIYISVFYSMSPLGIRTLATSVMEFLSGAIIPLPFFP
nr:ABC transporter permease [bacterium]